MKRPDMTVIPGRTVTHPMRDASPITRLLKSRQDKKVTPIQGGLNKLLRRFHEEIKIHTIIMSLGDINYLSYRQDKRNLGLS